MENGDLIQNTDLLNYLPMIYGTVQSDEKYKRLHNYASSETMYKNLTAAVLLGGIPEILFATETSMWDYSGYCCGLDSFCNPSNAPIL